MIVDTGSMGVNVPGTETKEKSDQAVELEQALVLHDAMLKIRLVLNDQSKVDHFVLSFLEPFLKGKIIPWPQIEDLGSLEWHLQRIADDGDFDAQEELLALTNDLAIWIVEQAEIARSQGMDFATTLLYQQVLQSERFGPAIESILKGPDRWIHSRPAPLLAVVPGAFHGENMDTGADGQRFLDIADAHGFHSQPIATHSFGSLRQNAQVIAEWLGAHAQEEVILITLSKGAAEICYLLQSANEALFRNVVAIVNVSGMIFGTRLVNWVAERALPRLYVRGLMWWKSYDFQNLLELRHNEMKGSLSKLPVRMINVIGFPLE